jgi:hypothetical protein
MKLVGSGYIQRLFAAKDEQTILRRPNIRRYAKENGVKYYVIQSVWLIDIDGFMKTIAPKEYDGESTMPRLRCIQTAVVEYNKSHKQQIDKHVVEKCMQSSKVFKYNHGNRWIINYDELEPVIDEFLSNKASGLLV